MQAKLRVPAPRPAPAPTPAPVPIPIPVPLPEPQYPSGGSSIHVGSPGESFRALEMTAVTKLGDGEMRRDAANKAIVAWNELNHSQRNGRSLSVPGTTGAYRNSANDRSIGHLWPLSQVQAAALGVAALTQDDGAVRALEPVLQRYVRSGSFMPDIDGRGDTLRYTDDNMAMGLNYVQAYRQTGDRTYLEKAEAVMPFMEAMIDNATGGLAWYEGGNDHVADSIAGGQKLALLLAQEAGGDTAKRDRFLAFAHTMDDFLETRLRAREGDKEGLVLDNVDSTSKVAAWSDHIFSYNQGWSIGADIEWYRTTGDRAYLDRARHTADRTIAYYSSVPLVDGIWSQPPSFNANFFENLLALEAIDPPADGSHPYEDRLRSYLDRAWVEARDPNTGWFDDGRIGSYTGGPGGTDRVDTIDQAGMVQMYALLAMTPAQRAAVV